MNNSSVANFVYDQQMKAQSLAVLAILSQTDPEQVGAKWNKEFCQYKYNQQTAPWYNGREIGFSLMIENPASFKPGASRNNLIIVCSEYRRSDDIVVYCWEANLSMMNPPTLADFSDEIYNNKQFFRYLDIKGSVEYIVEKIKNFVTSNNDA